MKDEFYIPDKENVRLQSKKNKQVSEGQVSTEAAEQFIKELKDDAKILYQAYTDHMERGIGREQARIELQQNLYTEFYWTVDLHNLLHFLALRCDKHAQQEIQVYSNAIVDLIRPIVPVTMEAWEDYHPMRNALLLTAKEVEALKKFIKNAKGDKEILFVNIDSQNKGEIAEWIEKAERLEL
jgi:thymidylate synthase (FAD)